MPPPVLAVRTARTVIAAPFDLDLDFDLDQLVDSAPGQTVPTRRRPRASVDEVQDSDGAADSDAEISAWLEGGSASAVQSSPGRVSGQWDWEDDALLGLVEAPRRRRDGERVLLLGTDHEDRELMRPEPSVHSALLHEGEAALLDGVADYLRLALADGDAIALVVGPARREALLGSLPQELLRQAQQRGRVTVQDARATLSLFLRDGVVDEDLFERRVAAPFRMLTRGPSWVSAYGEMTTMLWAEGNVVGALRLEQLWTDLQSESSFSMLCAYPLTEVQDDSGDPLPALCSVHTATHLR